MSLSPLGVHANEQLRAVLRELAGHIAAYRNELRTNNVPDAEAWALTQRLEERLIGRLIDRAEQIIAARRQDG